MIFPLYAIGVELWGLFTPFKIFLQSAWANYPGGLILCPHCAALMKNGYIEKAAQTITNEEEYEL